MEDTTDAVTASTATPDTTATASGTDVTDWSPETVEADTGVALDGDGLPVNHRLRAERLARDGKDSDPGGMIEDSLIADAGKRLAAIAKAYPPVRSNMPTADLTKIADRERVDLSGATTNADRVELINASRTAAGVTVEGDR